MLGGTLIGKLQNFNSYSHQIDAIGGFISSNIELGVIEPIAEDWLEHGLGRIVQIRDHISHKVFRGVVDTITLVTGSDSETRGPLFDIANRAMAIYTPRDFSVFPPVDGSTTTTLLSDDTDSQALFGIIEKDVSAGSTTEDVALKVRDNFIYENSFPKTTGNLDLSQQLGYTLTVNLVGNYNWFRAYVYNYLTPEKLTPYNKLMYILQAEPNGILSQSLMKWEDDLLPIMERMEINNRFAWDIMNDVLSLGNDIDDRKRSFGVYDDDVTIYRVAPTTAKYVYKINDPRQYIMDQAGKIVLPWMIRPGDWINVPDWLLGRKLYAPTALSKDPRNKYIETVSYTSPWQVSISGTPNDNLSRMLAKITYTGGIY
jgi:hypothetical protein